uniref:Putative secreted protein n=1 Tax=Anopheles marajoara TaxID=58244 RepID=A0A2M4C932_9DIPT
MLRTGWYTIGFLILRVGQLHARVTVEEQIHRLALFSLLFRWSKEFRTQIELTWINQIVVAAALRLIVTIFRFRLLGHLCSCSLGGTWLCRRHCRMR